MTNLLSTIELSLSSMALCLTVAGFLIPCTPVGVVGFVLTAITVGMLLQRHLDSYHRVRY